MSSELPNAGASPKAILVSGYGVAYTHDLADKVQTPVTIECLKADSSGGDSRSTRRKFMLFPDGTSRM